MSIEHAKKYVENNEQLKILLIGGIRKHMIQPGNKTVGGTDVTT